jgi:hypothetical protein
MTDPTALLKACELHVHVGGCFSTGDLVDLAHRHVDDIDFGPYVEAYEAAYGARPEPATWIRRAADGDDAAFEALRDHYVFTERDGPDFTRFSAKFGLLICVARHYLRHVPGGQRVGPQIALEHHRRSGVRYLEMRAMYMSLDDPQGFHDFHRLNAQVAQQMRGGGFEPRYVPSLPREAPLPAYEQLRRMLTDEADLAEIVVGVDLCHVEEGHPPKGARDLFRRIREDAEGDLPLEGLYHVGEIYFDKSLESAVRWCHEAADLGARRLGHCIALGLDPEASVQRRGVSHERETVAERLDQIDYDLHHRSALEDAGVEVRPAQLEAERESLRSQRRQAIVQRSYDDQRFEQVRRRQAFVLGELSRIGTVIESCPSSNLRLGSVPRPELHPVHRFLETDVDLVIGADDPGIFDSELADEIDWVVDTTHLTPAALAERLGDPLRFRLRQGVPL